MDKELVVLLGDKYVLSLYNNNGECVVTVREQTEYKSSRICIPLKLFSIGTHVDVLLISAVKKSIDDLTVFNGIEVIGEPLNPYEEYVKQFAKNHGISAEEAASQPMCKARLDYFNATGK